MRKLVRAPGGGGGPHLELRQVRARRVTGLIDSSALSIIDEGPRPAEPRPPRDGPEQGEAAARGAGLARGWAGAGRGRTGRAARHVSVSYTRLPTECSPGAATARLRKLRIYLTFDLR